ncbi:MAG TPA: VOC family protein [Pirellulales bacterium]|nr:VOC family protein [Pirellulales bacterium]
MSKSVQPIPPGHESPIPHLVCSPCSEAIEFYKKAFGAEEIRRMPSPDGRIMHAAIRLGKGFVFLVDDFPEYCGGKASTPKALGGTPVTIHQYVADCDATVERAKEAGATLLMGPHDMFWGDRYAQVLDPYGHKWSIATHIKDMTPEEMQAGMKQAFSPESSCGEAAKTGTR